MDKANQMRWVRKPQAISCSSAAVTKEVLASQLRVWNADGERMQRSVISHLQMQKQPWGEPSSTPQPPNRCCPASTPFISSATGMCIILSVILSAINHVLFIIWYENATYCILSSVYTGEQCWLSLPHHTIKHKKTIFTPCQQYI